MDQEIDLTDRLRFAADSLSADFGDALSADSAEALVFSSAEGLLATASVRDFVPILAERRARRAVRSRATAPPAVPEATPVEIQPETPPAPALPPASPSRSAEPLLAVPAEHLNRLRDRVDLVRVRVSDWRADLDRR